MCLVKKPKIKTSADDQKDPPVLRNPILDGMLGNIAAIRGGRNALRIDLANPLAIPAGGGTGTGVGGGGGGAPSSGGTSSGSSSGGSGGSTGGSSYSGGGGGGGFSSGRTLSSF